MINKFAADWGSHGTNFYAVDSLYHQVEVASLEELILKVPKGSEIGVESASVSYSLGDRPAIIASTLKKDIALVTLSGRLTAHRRAEPSIRPWMPEKGPQSLEKNEENDACVIMQTLLSRVTHFSSFRGVVPPETCNPTLHDELSLKLVVERRQEYPAFERFVKRLPNLANLHV